MEKVIYRYYDIERNMSIKLGEFVDLLNEYDFAHPHRLAFALLGVTGVRGCELCSLRFDDFNEEFTEVKVRVAKKKPKKYVSGTLSYNIPIVKRKLPEWLSSELKFYVNHNYHLFKDRRLFPFSSDTLRRYLSRMRDKANKDQLKSKELQNGLLETISESIASNTVINTQYRISLHSFRRMHISIKYQEFKDIAKLIRYTGHSFEKTAYGYVYDEENIGLPKELKGKKDIFDRIVKKKSQTLLEEY